MGTTNTGSGWCMSCPLSSTFGATFALASWPRPARARSLARSAMRAIPGARHAPAHDVPAFRAARAGVRESRRVPTPTARAGVRDVRISRARSGSPDRTEMTKPVAEGITSGWTPAGTIAAVPWREVSQESSLPSQGAVTPGVAEISMTAPVRVAGALGPTRSWRGEARATLARSSARPWSIVASARVAHAGGRGSAPPEPCCAPPQANRRKATDRAAALRTVRVWITPDAPKLR